MPRMSGYRKGARGGRTWAASKIQNAWKAKKRKKVGLVQRTLERNYQQIKKLKRAPELRYIDNSLGQNMSGDVDIDGDMSAGTHVMLNLLSGVAQGDDHNQRQGREVALKRLTVHVKFIPPSGITAESANKCTAVLVHDKSPGESGGQPRIQELYDLPTPQATLNTAFYNPITVGGTGQSEKRFKVLARKSIWVGSQPNCMPEGYLTLSTTSPYKINYGDELTVAASAVNQTLRLFLYSDSANAPHPRFSVHAKFSYTDP